MIWHRAGDRWREGPASDAERLAVAVDGASPLEHGWVRGERDDGASLAEALRVLAEAALPVSAVTRVTRSNHRSLDRIGASVRGADAWVLVLPEVTGPRFDALSPRLAMAMPWLLRAADRWGARAFVAGAPLCLMGPHAARSLDLAPRAYAEPCDGCAARPRCPGVAEAYAARFGGDELRARAPVSVTAPGRDLWPPALQSLGTG